MNKKNLMIIVGVGIVIVGAVVLFMQPKDEEVTGANDEKAIVKEVEMNNENLIEGEEINILAGEIDPLEPLYLSCDNDYDLSLSFYQPNEEGVMTGLSVMGTDGEEMFNYVMVPAISASGAKYQTEDEVYVMWEHQGTFELSKNEEVIATCTQAKK